LNPQSIAEFESPPCDCSRWTAFGQEALRWLVNAVAVAMSLYYMYVAGVRAARTDRLLSGFGPASS